MRDLRGFTLIEVLIALTIGSMVVLTAHQLFSHASAGTQRLATAGAVFGDEQLAVRWLNAAFRSLDVGDDAGSFDGESDHMSFSSWTRQPGGWMERTRMTLSRAGEGLEARSSMGAIRLQRGVSRVEFDYLLVPGADSRWVTTWVSPANAPLAVRVRLFRPNRVDTLLFAIGARG